MKAGSKILVAMSGGVDSSLAAALLVEQGYEVIGGFMKNWSGSVKMPQADGSFVFEECDWKTERRDALRVASQLGIPLETFDFEEQYRARVYQYMIDEYAAGRTPNPDVLCNSEVKFDLLLAAADQLGCAYLATGHYARVERTGGRAVLKKGVDSAKDQSYFLCQLGQAELSRALFPVGELTKTEVREAAAARGLVTSGKKDSQGLCFVGKVDMPTFLQERIAPKTGPIVTTSGEHIGEHEGVQFFTIGQRHGLGIGGGDPWYVVRREVEENRLVVGHDDDPALYATELTATQVHWVAGEAPVLPLRCTAKIRYRQEDQECVVASADKNSVHVTFTDPQRAIAPGQFVVFYDGEELLGSGVIAS